MRREAKKLARMEGITYSHALDRFAKAAGYSNWSLLHRNEAAEHRSQTPYAFQRNDVEMEDSLRVVKPPSRWDSRTRGDIARDLARDIADKFISPANAVDFATAYMDALLRRPRYRVHSGSVAYQEMRCWLPYGIETVDGSTSILVNRNYKPVGSKAQDFARYEQFTQLHAVIRPSEFHIFARPGTLQPFLYNDGCLPWRSRDFARHYRDRLIRLRTLLS